MGKIQFLKSHLSVIKQFMETRLSSAVGRAFPLSDVLIKIGIQLSVSFWPIFDYRINTDLYEMFTA